MTIDSNKVNVNTKDTQSQTLLSFSSPVISPAFFKQFCSFSAFLPATAHLKFRMSFVFLATSSTTNWPVNPDAPNTTKSYFLSAMFYTQSYARLGSTRCDWKVKCPCLSRQLNGFAKCLETYSVDVTLHKVIFSFRHECALCAAMCARLGYHVNKILFSCWYMLSVSWRRHL